MSTGARHHEEDAALAVHHHEDDRGQRDQRGEADELRRQRVLERAHHERQRFRGIAHLRVVDRAHRGDRHEHVDRSAYGHGADDADREVAARVLRLLRRSRDRVEPIEREEDDRRRRHDTAFHAICARVAAQSVRRERREIVGRERRHGEQHEGRERHHLDDHEHDVDGGAFARAGHEHAGDGQRHDDGGQVDDAARMWPGEQHLG
jgi:hypothetical protein